MRIKAEGGKMDVGKDGEGVMDEEINPRGGGDENRAKTVRNKGRREEGQGQVDEGSDSGGRAGGGGRVAEGSEEGK